VRKSNRLQAEGQRKLVGAALGLVEPFGRSHLSNAPWPRPLVHERELPRSTTMEKKTRHSSTHTMGAEHSRTPRTPRLGDQKSTAISPLQCFFRECHHCGHFVNAGWNRVAILMLNFPRRVFLSNMCLYPTLMVEASQTCLHVSLSLAINPDPELTPCWLHTRRRK
jgi:hypothetical protein